MERDSVTRSEPIRSQWKALVRGFFGSILNRESKGGGGGAGMKGSRGFETGERGSGGSESAGGEVGAVGEGRSGAGTTPGEVGGGTRGEFSGCKT